MEKKESVKAASKHGHQSDAVKKASSQKAASVSSSTKLRRERQQKAFEEQLRLDEEQDRIHERAEMEKIRCEFELKALNRRREMARQKAMIEECDEEDSKSVDGQDVGQEDIVGVYEESLGDKMARLSMKTVSEAGAAEESQLFRRSEDMTQEMLRHIIRLQPLHITDFDGADDYFAFKNEFRQLEKRAVHTDDELLSILLAHVKGDAKRAVAGILHGGGQYAKAWEILDSRYGNKTRITSSRLEAVRKHMNVETNNLSQLRSLIDAVSAFLEAMRSAERIQETDNALLIVDILPKLPRGMAYGWNKLVAKKQAAETLTRFKEFLVFEEKIWEVDAANQNRDQSARFQEKKSKIETKKPFRSTRYVGVSVALSGTECPLHPGKAHPLEKCYTFLRKTVSERVKLARKFGLCFLCLSRGHMTSTCSRSIKCSHPGCGKLHHELLHATQTEPNADRVTAHGAASEAAVGQTSPDVQTYSARRVQQALLGVIPVKITGPGGSMEINAFLDYGSNTTMVSMTVAKKIGVVTVDMKTRPIEIIGIHGTGKCNATYVDQLMIQGTREGSRALTANAVLAVEDLIGPSQEVDWDKLKAGFPTLDPASVSHTSAKPAEMIVGTDNFHLMLYDGYVQSACEQGLVLVHTALGNALFGKAPGIATSASYRAEVKISPALSQQLDEYFLSEGLGVESNRQCLLSVEEQTAMTKIAAGTRRMTEEQAFVSAMPWKSNAPCLPNNKQMALNRLYSLEKKLTKAPELYDQYRKAIIEDVQKGYIREISAEQDETEGSCIKWYLPHWNVTHKKKPEKFRRVYDCSAVFENESLNRQLMKGPNLLSDLLDILIRFREYPVAMAADIGEMYNQVRIPPEDQYCLQFLWRDDVSSPVKTFRFSRMLFGDVSAPCRAVHVLKCIAQEGEADYPHGAKAIRDNMYLDDFMISCPSEQSACIVQHEVNILIEQGGFRFKKWVSNVPTVLQTISPADRASGFEASPKGGTLCNPVLGVIWEIHNDCFVYQSQELEFGSTKRQVLSQMSSIWDPMGFLAPYVVRAKMMVQELWTLKLSWDEQLPKDFLSRWRRWMDELKCLQEVKIPRPLLSRYECPSEFSLQVFCDASEKAYGVVIYCRSVYSDGAIECRFLIAKTRVAPVKPSLTIPRLELNAAVLATRLVVKVSAALTRPIQYVDFWSDSSIVLSWLERRITNETVFVVNRISEIEENVREIKRKKSVPAVVQWRHVRSEENASDDCTRGLHLEDMTANQKCRFLEGPDFLKQPREKWSAYSMKSVSLQADELSPGGVWQTKVVEQGELFDLHRYSTYIKAQRVVAFVLRFIHNAKCKTTEQKRQGHLRAPEYLEAEIVLCKVDQQTGIRSQFDGLLLQKKGRQHLDKLCPMDDDGIIRVGGRLGQSMILNYSLKHPIVLDGKRRLAYLIVKDIHERHGHMGVQFVISLVRTRFWILKLSWLVKTIKRNCVVCRRRDCHTLTPQMAALPPARIEPVLPFIRCGVDYFGPFLVRRGRSQEKVWGVIFTCFSTRAVHLELADSLSADCFINVFRRFTGRRGEVNEVWSDNGTNFVGAEHELKKELQKLRASGLSEELAARGVQWHFNPPAASHFGGAWERLIRSVRKALYVVMRGREMKFSIFETALVEVEALLNSRPISKVSTDEQDMTALTPGHFLILRPFTARSYAVIQDKEINSRNAWRTSQAIVNMFWRRWMTEYVPNLQERHKWHAERPNVNVNDVVMLIDNSTPRGKWPLGLVVKVYPGQDGVVRVVDVKIHDDIVHRRPVAKLVHIFGVNEDIAFR